MSDPVAADCPANSTDANIGIVVSDWQPEISNALLEQTVEKLKQCGVMEEDIYISHVPGVMELPFGARQMNNVMEPSAVIMLGSVVKENNSFYDIICQTVSRGITHLNLHGDIPFIFGVVTADTEEEAKKLTQDGVGAKSALAALKMVNMMAKLVNQ
jgi:6,7-dimethyl-8-ribityllumazine synthase